MTHNITINSSGNETIVTAWEETRLESRVDPSDARPNVHVWAGLGEGTEVKQLWSFTAPLEFEEFATRLKLALMPDS